jgi:SAM-dependent methyltransferase
MDVRAFEIDVDARRVRARVVDAAGERWVEIDGAAGARLVAALAPHVAAVSRSFVAEVKPRPAIAPGTAIDADFWSAIWREGRDGWELGRAAPPIARWVAAHAAEVAGARALVVGSGRGHEARLLARAGARVVAVDVAPEAVAAARALDAAAGVTVDVRRADLFDLPRGPERFDLVLEHCCFCAIDPARRDEYVHAVADVLEPGGRLVGLFWAHGREGGPPFTTTRAELEARLGTRFAVEHLEVPPDSVGVRLGQELLVAARRR